MSDNKKIYEWVYNAKTIGIILMIMGHGNLVSFTDFIYSFHMPLFFIISGFLYKPRGIKDESYRCVKSLLIPYFILNLICLLYKSFISPFDALELLPSRIFSIFLGNTGLYGLPLVCPPSWFLIALCISRLVLSTIYYLKIDNRYLVVLFGAVLSGICILLVCLLHFFNMRFPVCLDSALLAIPFMVFGFIFKSIPVGLKKFTKVVLVIVLYIITFCANYFNGRVDMMSFVTGRYLILYYVSSLSGSMMIIMVSKLLPFKPFVKLFSDGTLLILGFNLIGISWVYKVLGLLHLSLVNDVEGVLISLFLLFCFYPFIIFAKRYFPIILGNR